jgi:uncharacterized RDD family membrane protein YckC
MKIIKVETPFNIELEFKIADFPQRMGAWFIDIAIICLFYYLMYDILFRFFGKNVFLSVFLQLFILIVPVMLYQLVFELMMNGQTLGKKIVGIKILDIQGNEPTWGQYFIRWILCISNIYVYIIPFAIISITLDPLSIMFFFLIIYIPDVLSVLVSRNSQKLSDLAAGTIVIDSRFKPNISDTIFLEICDTAYTPMFPQVMKLTDRDINGIRNLLNTRQGDKNSMDYMTDIALKIKSVLSISSDLHPSDFLKQLLMDYNFLSAK